MEGTELPGKEAMIRITRKVEFSAAHFYHNPNFSAEENRRVFGKCNNPHGHGHNYVLEVTIAGEPDPATGMVLDLKELKEILQREVVERMDHRHLNYEVPELAGKIPTCENIAAVIWSLLEPKITQGKLDRVRLYESPDLFADCTADGAGNAGARRRAPMKTFADAPLPVRGLAPTAQPEIQRGGEPAALRQVQQSLRARAQLRGRSDADGPGRSGTGMIANLGELDPFVEREVIEAFDHKYLNEEVPEFRESCRPRRTCARRSYRRLRDFPRRGSSACGSKRRARTVLNIAGESSGGGAPRGTMRSKTDDEPDKPKSCSRSGRDRRASRTWCARCWSSRRRPEPRGACGSTPERFEKALRFLTSGYQQDPDKMLNGAMFSVCYDEMVLVKDIEVYSLCEHHLLPFFGKCHVAYIPEQESGRPEQDRAAREHVRAAPADSGAADEPDREDDPRKLSPLGVGVIIEARHLCMVMRGVEKQHSAAVTSAMLGAFRENKQTRDEFLSLIRGAKP